MFALVLLFSCSSLAIAADKPGEIPDWALGALSFGRLQTGVDKAGAYASKFMPNLGALAKQAIMSKLFKVPVGAGIANGPATVYLLDPVVTGLTEATAFILPIADAATARADLIAALGPPTLSHSSSDEDTIMTFTVLQPPPADDETLLVKLTQGHLLAAPNAAILKKLEFVAERENKAAPVKDLNDAEIPDARLAVKVGAVRRLFETIVEFGLMQGAEMVSRDPRQTENLKAQIKQALNTLWQIDVIEAHLNFAPAGAPVALALELQIFPAKGTDLSTQLVKPATPTHGEMLRLLPQDAPLVGAWNLDGVPLVHWLRAELNEQKPAAGGQLDLLRALLDVLKHGNSEGAFTFSGTNETGTALALALRADDPKITEVALNAAIEKVQTNPSVPLASLGIAPLKQEVYAGRRIDRYQCESDLLNPSRRNATTFQVALTGTGLMLAYGKGGLEVLEKAIDIGLDIEREKQQHPLGNAVQARIGSLPKDTCALISAHLVSLARMEPISGGTHIEKMAGNLEDAIVTLSLRQTTTVIALRLDLPVDAAQAAYILFQSLPPMFATPPAHDAKRENVPAPPPAK